MINILKPIFLMFIISIGLFSGYFIASNDPGIGPYHHIVRMWSRNITGPGIHNSLGVNYPVIEASDYDWKIWESLGNIKPEFPKKQTENFTERLHKATGFNDIKLKSENVEEKYRTGLTGKYLDGKITEVFVDYIKPLMSVRLLFAEHTDKKSSELMVIFPGSWGSSEHIMGLRKGDYHRNIGKHFFQKGMDIAAYDSADNGQIETWLNTLFKMQGAQAYGVWSRAVCDLMNQSQRNNTPASSIGNWRKKYKNIYLYGISRAGRTVEYIAALCPGFKFVFVGDNTGIFYQDYFWDYHDSSNYLKYGVWQDHLVPFLSHTSTVDLMYASHSPMIYTLSKVDFERHRDVFSISSNITDNIENNQRHRFIFKSDIGHKPELEYMEKIISGEWEDLSGVSLSPLFNNE